MTSSKAHSQEVLVMGLEPRCLRGNWSSLFEIERPWCREEGEFGCSGVGGPGRGVSGDFLEDDGGFPGFLFWVVIQRRG